MSVKSGQFRLGRVDKIRSGWSSRVTSARVGLSDQFSPVDQVKSSCSGQFRFGQVHQISSDWSG